VAGGPVEVEPLSTALIERYLESRGLRYYQGRGGKDLLVLFTTDQGRLHVNLQIWGSAGMYWWSRSPPPLTTMPPTARG